jgi:hypothetical protein
MKYAFIALVVLYLITYGCSPDNSEKATESHEQSTSAAVEHAPQGEMAAPAEQHAAAPAEPATVVEATQQPAEVVKQVQGEPVIEAEQVIMPCGKMMALSDIPENAPCLKPHWKAPRATTEPTEETKDLAAALQRMIDTTNDMVLATKQLVDATQELLKSSKETQESTEVPQKTPPVTQ